MPSCTVDEEIAFAILTACIKGRNWSEMMHHFNNLSDVSCNIQTNQKKFKLEDKFYLSNPVYLPIYVKTVSMLFFRK